MTQRRIYSPVESDELFVKIANGFQSLIIFVKSSILDVRLGSEYTSVTYESDNAYWFFR